MNCCANCFNDQELTGFIISNSTETGNCNFCGTNSTEVLDPREFEEKFLQLVQVYEFVDNPVPEHIEPAILHEKLQRQWGIFTEDLDPSTRDLLLKSILTDLYEGGHVLFSTPVELKTVLFDIGEADVLEEEWDLFATEIKSNNRYFLGKSINLELLKDLFRIHTKVYTEGKLFYRARISDRNGFELNKMGKPPAKSSVSGRANPIGIFLPLCFNE